MLKESVLQGTRKTKAVQKKLKSKQTILRKRKQSMRLGDGIGKSMIVNFVGSD